MKNHLIVYIHGKAVFAEPSAEILISFTMLRNAVGNLNRRLRRSLGHPVARSYLSSAV